MNIDLMLPLPTFEQCVDLAVDAGFHERFANDRVHGCGNMVEKLVHAAYAKGVLAALASLDERAP
jgi:hypothetical protein